MGTEHDTTCVLYHREGMELLPCHYHRFVYNLRQCNDVRGEIGDSREEGGGSEECGRGGLGEEKVVQSEPTTVLKVVIYEEKADLKFVCTFILLFSHCMVMVIGWLYQQRVHCKSIVALL